MIFAPLKLSMLPMRFVLLSIYAFLNWYILKFFIKPSMKFFPELSYFALFIWIFIAVVWFWSYIIVCWLDAGSSEHALSKANREEAEKIFDKKCSKCGLPKPASTHHCSKCNKCYVGFDHHCFIVGNCIAYRNAQPFVIFLIYGDLIFLYACVISFFAKAFYSRLNSTIAVFAGIAYGALTYSLFVFAKLSYTDYVKGRTAYERATGQSKESDKRIKIGSIFPVIGKQNPFIVHKHRE